LTFFRVFLLFLKNKPSIPGINTKADFVKASNTPKLSLSNINEAASKKIITNKEVISDSYSAAGVCLIKILDVRYEEIAIIT